MYVGGHVPYDSNTVRIPGFRRSVTTQPRNGLLRAEIARSVVQEQGAKPAIHEVE